MRKFAFVEIVNYKKKSLRRLVPICQAVRVIAKTERAMEVL